VQVHFSVWTGQLQTVEIGSFQECFGQIWRVFSVFACFGLFFCEASDSLAAGRVRSKNTLQQAKKQTKTGSNWPKLATNVCKTFPSPLCVQVHFSVYHKNPFQNLPIPTVCAAALFCPDGTASDSRDGKVFKGVLLVSLVQFGVFCFFLACFGLFSVRHRAA